MTPETLVIDRSFKGVGRIKKASGTTIPQVRRKLSRMLTALADEGRIDILRAIRDGDLTLMQVHDAYQRHALAELPTAATVKPAAVAMKVWIDGLAVPDDCSAKHKESLETSRRYVEKAAPKATLAELPRVLEQLRDTLGKPHPRSFNLARAAALAFVRSTLKRSHPLWLAIAAVEPRKVPKGRTPQPLHVEQMRNLFPAPLTDAVDAIAWGMATTGMGAREYWGQWSVRADSVHIAGTKRAGRVRDVPLIQAPAVPRIHRRTFEDKMRARTGPGVQAYDLRRTYANWLESAGVPRTRRKMYLGHGTRDVTDLYERHDVHAFLQADAATLCAFLGLPHTKAHTMTLLDSEGAQR